MIKYLIILLLIILIILILIYSYEPYFEYMSKKKTKELESIFLKNNNNELTKTPKILMQTYYDKKLIPKKVYDNVKLYAGEYEHIIFDDNECINFLKENYNEEIVNRFNNLSKGAFKADLFRYCWLYKNGGVYLDIKVHLIKNLKDIFKDDTQFYTVKTKNNNAIFQGIISTPVNNPIFKTLISKMLLRSNLILNIDYSIVTRDFYNELIKDKKGYTLFQEICNTKETKDIEPSPFRNNLQCAIYNNDERVFITRYSDYPWKN